MVVCLVPITTRANDAAALIPVAQSLVAPTSTVLETQLRSMLAQLTEQLNSLLAQKSGGATSGSSGSGVSNGVGTPQFSRNLAMGMHGEDVHTLQLALKRTGDYTYDSITGYYGAATQAAVARFQCRELLLCRGSAAENGYGALGPLTRKTLQRFALMTPTSSDTTPTPTVLLPQMAQSSSTVTTSPNQTTPPIVPQNILGVSATTVSTTTPVANVNRPAALQPNVPFVIMMRQTAGSLLSGEPYIFYHDSESATDGLLQFKTKSKYAKYPNPNTTFDQGTVLLWGARTTFDGRNCLMQNSVCVATVTPLFDGSSPEIRRKFESYPALNKNELSRWLQTVKDGATSPTPPPFGSVRSLADALRYGSNAYAIAYRPADRLFYESYLRDAATALMAIPPSKHIRSTYNNYHITGASEYITLPTVLEALITWRNAFPADTALVNNYVSNSWKELQKLTSNEATPNFSTFWKRLIEGPKQLSAPNGFGLYLVSASALDALSVPIDTTWVTPGVIYLMDHQTTKQTQTTCSSRDLAQIYGGWAHDSDAAPDGSDDNCAQKMGYHGFITRGLVALHDRLTQTGACTGGAWSSVCQNLPRSIAAALAWVVNNQDPVSQGLWDIAPGSQLPPPHTGQPTLWGSGVGIDVAMVALISLRTHGYTDSSTIPVSYDGATRTITEIEQKLEQTALSSSFPGAPIFVGNYVKYLALKKVQ